MLIASLKTGACMNWGRFESDVHVCLELYVQIKIHQFEMERFLGFI